MSPNLKIYKTKDNASGQLNAGISAGATSIPLQSGDGAAFPSTINGTATSSGDADTLNSTGIGSSGVAVGDQIYNITDGSWAIIESISTNSIETTPLQGGSGNTWDNSDAWVVGAFIATIVQYNTTNDPDTGVNKREKVLVTQRSTDTLTVVRGYDDSTAQSFLTNDNVYLFMKTADLKGVQDGLADLLLRMVDIEAEILADVLRRDGSVAMNNNTALKARNAANSADISLFKLLSSDILEFQTLPRNPSSRSISDDYDLIDKKYFADNSSALGTLGAGATSNGDGLHTHNNLVPSFNIPWYFNNSTGVAANDYHPSVVGFSDAVGAPIITLAVNNFDTDEAYLLGLKTASDIGAALYPTAYNNISDGVNTVYSGLYIGTDYWGSDGESTSQCISKNGTDVTISGTNPSASAPLLGHDPTNSYLLVKDTTTTIKRYSGISGTTITFVSTITLANACDQDVGFVYDNTNQRYICADKTNNLIRIFNSSGTLVTSVAYTFDDTNLRGLCFIGSRLYAVIAMEDIGSAEVLWFAFIPTTYTR